MCSVKGGTEVESTHNRSNFSLREEEEEEEEGGQCVMNAKQTEELERTAQGEGMDRGPRRNKELI